MRVVLVLAMCTLLVLGRPSFRHHTVGYQQDGRFVYHGHAWDRDLRRAHPLHYEARTKDRLTALDLDENVADVRCVGWCDDKDSANHFSHT